MEIHTVLVRDRLQTRFRSERRSSKDFSIAELLEFLKTFLSRIILDRGEFEQRRLACFLKFLFWEVRFQDHGCGYFECWLEDSRHCRHAHGGVERGDGAGAFDAEEVELFNDFSATPWPSAPLGQLERETGEAGSRCGFAAGPPGNHQSKGNRLEPRHPLAQDDQAVREPMLIKRLLHSALSLSNPCNPYTRHKSATHEPTRSS